VVVDLTWDIQLCYMKQNKPLNDIPLVFSILSDLKGIKPFPVKTEKTMD